MQLEGSGAAPRAAERDTAGRIYFTLAAVKLSGKIVTVTGEYLIDETGKQLKNEFAVVQTLPNGLEVVYPPPVATAKPVYPVPPFAKRN